MIRRMLVTLSAGSFPMLVAVVAINIRAQINALDIRLLFIIGSNLEMTVAEAGVVLRLSADAIVAMIVKPQTGQCCCVIDDRVIGSFIVIHFSQI